MMEMEYMVERLLARIDANMKTMQEKTDAIHKEMNANIKFNQEQILAKMEAKRQIDREEKKAEQEKLKRMMEEKMIVNQAKRDGELKEFTETIEKTDGIKDGGSVPRRAGKETPGRPSKIRPEQLRDYDYTHVTILETFNKTCSATEATKREF
jgi:hypothetical protein